MDTAWIALIGTVFGGAGLKVIEKLLSRGSEKVDVASEIRDELRSDLATLRAELKQQEADADKWQAMYWELKSELLIVNHKANKAVEAVDEQHPERHLGEDLKGLEYPGR